MFGLDLARPKIEKYYAIPVGQLVTRLVFVGQDLEVWNSTRYLGMKKIIMLTILT